MSFITKAKAKDMSFMFKAKAKDFCFSDLKAKDTVSLRTFQGLLPIREFIFCHSLQDFILA